MLFLRHYITAWLSWQLATGGHIPPGGQATNLSPTHIETAGQPSASLPHLLRTFLGRGRRATDCRGRNVLARFRQCNIGRWRTHRVGSGPIDRHSRGIVDLCARHNRRSSARTHLLEDEQNGSNCPSLFDINRSQRFTGQDYIRDKPGVKGACSFMLCTLRLGRTVIVGHPQGDTAILHRAA